VNGENGAATVVGIGQQRGELEGVEIGEQAVVGCLGFFISRGVVGFIRQFIERNDIVEFGTNRLEAVDPALVAGDFLEQRLGLLLAVPESGFGGFGFEPGYGVAAGIEVKGTSATCRGAGVAFRGRVGRLRSLQGIL
jgi:hypothetical protein